MNASVLVLHALAVRGEKGKEKGKGKQISSPTPRTRKNPWEKFAAYLIPHIWAEGGKSTQEFSPPRDLIFTQHPT